VKLRLNFTLVLGLVALALAVIQWIHPFGGRSRLSPLIVLVILLLVGIRYAARQQAQKRSEVVKAVPKRPLGITDEFGQNSSADDSHPPDAGARKD